MLALFYIFIGVAIGVSVWQITRIMDFRGSIADDNDNAAQGKYAIGFLAFLYAMMIYCLIFMNVIMLPESASIEGEHDDNLFDITSKSSLDKLSLSGFKFSFIKTKIKEFNMI